MGAAAPACSLGKPHVASLRTGSVRVLRPPPRPPRLCACASGLKASGPFSGVFEGATCRSVSVASGLRLLVSAPMPRAPSQRAVCSACVSGPPGLEGVAGARQRFENRDGERPTPGLQPKLLVARSKPPDTEKPGPPLRVVSSARAPAGGNKRNFRMLGVATSGLFERREGGGAKSGAEKRRGLID
ncbi:uncharacterized protein LOC103159165 [Cricetulus griseus]|uniref:uncharacterized protein LOC103159165 n=1 Tax=Cricetulus griseus TaxID=10029 RepID=UPI0015C2E86A|nr:uncharacterized protein LOC103159165 [Cricetulus griseus]